MGVNMAFDVAYRFKVATSGPWATIKHGQLIIGNMSMIAYANTALKGVRVVKSVGV